MGERLQWQNRSHMKRKAYAPNVKWIVGEWKHGEPTIRECAYVEIEEAFALRDYADDQGVHLSDVFVDALQVGTVGVDLIDACRGMQEHLDTAQARYREAVRLERQARDDSAVMELRWSRMRRRERALHVWGGQVRHKAMNAQEREALRVLDERNAEYVPVATPSVEAISVDLGFQVRTCDATGSPENPHRLAERIPVSVHASLRRETSEAQLKNPDIKLADIMRTRIRRFLQILAINQAIQRGTVQLRKLRQDIAASRARRRAYLRMAKVWQIRRQRMKRRLDFITGFRSRAHRVSTPGERTAFDEHEADPDASDIDGEMHRREVIARQRSAVDASLRRRPAAA